MIFYKNTNLHCELYTVYVLKVILLKISLFGILLRYSFREIMYFEVRKGFLNKYIEYKNGNSKELMGGKRVNPQILDCIILMCVYYIYIYIL